VIFLGVARIAQPRCSLFARAASCPIRRGKAKGNKRQIVAGVVQLGNGGKGGKTGLEEL
jgi:hypothetical protein